MGAPTGKGAIYAWCCAHRAPHNHGRIAWRRVACRRGRQWDLKPNRSVPGALHLSLAISRAHNCTSSPCTTALTHAIHRTARRVSTVLVVLLSNTAVGESFAAGRQLAMQAAAARARAVVAPARRPRLDAAPARAPRRRDRGRGDGAAASELSSTPEHLQPREEHRRLGRAALPAGAAAVCRARPRARSARRSRSSRCSARSRRTASRSSTACARRSTRDDVPRGVEKASTRGAAGRHGDVRSRRSRLHQLLHHPRRYGAADGARAARRISVGAGAPPRPPAPRRDLPLGRDARALAPPSSALAPRRCSARPGMVTRRSSRRRARSAARRARGRPVALAAGGARPGDGGGAGAAGVARVLAPRLPPSTPSRCSRPRSCACRPTAEQLRDKADYNKVVAAALASVVLMSAIAARRAAARYRGARRRRGGLGAHAAGGSSLATAARAPPARRSRARTRCSSRLREGVLRAVARRPWARAALPGCAARVAPSAAHARARRAPAVAAGDAGRATAALGARARRGARRARSPPLRVPVGSRIMPAAGAVYRAFGGARRSRAAHDHPPAASRSRPSAARSPCSGASREVGAARARSTRAPCTDTPGDRARRAGVKKRALLSGARARARFRRERGAHRLPPLAALAPRVPRSGGGRASGPGLCACARPGSRSNLP